MSEHPDSHSVRITTASRWLVEGCRIIKRRPIWIKRHRVWIDYDPGEFIPSSVARRNDNLTNQFIEGDVSVGGVIEMKGNKDSLFTRQILRGPAKRSLATFKDGAE